MEELGVETGVSTKKGAGSFFVDCTIETDQQALIPDSYIDITSEKIRIYKQLDSMTSDKEIDLESKKMEDRFGNMPDEVVNLFTVVKIRNLGASLGFEKIIIKNGMMLFFFIGNPMSPYYKSKEFTSILEKVNVYERIFTLKQTEGKLKLVCRGIDSLQKALSTLSLLSSKD
jgi:Transcription-repair coupling factor (superfamily II helicase)